MAVTKTIYRYELVSDGNNLKFHSPQWYIHVCYSSILTVARNLSIQRRTATGYIDTVYNIGAITEEKWKSEGCYYSSNGGKLFQYIGDEGLDIYIKEIYSIFGDRINISKCYDEANDYYYLKNEFKNFTCIEIKFLLTFSRYLHENHFAIMMKNAIELETNDILLVRLYKCHNKDNYNSNHSLFRNYKHGDGHVPKTHKELAERLKNKALTQLYTNMTSLEIETLFINNENSN